MFEEFSEHFFIIFYIQLKAKAKEREKISQFPVFFLSKVTKIFSNFFALIKI